MLSRRRFLATAASTSILSAIPRNAAFAETSGTPLPPPLAALKNRRDQAKPISLAERERRIERARSLMHEHGLDAICLIGGTSLVYFTGIRWWNSERLFTFVLPQKGNPFYVCPAFENDRAHEQLNKAPQGSGSLVYTWQED